MFELYKNPVFLKCKNSGFWRCSSLFSSFWKCCKIEHNFFREEREAYIKVMDAWGLESWHQYQ